MAYDPAKARAIMLRRYGLTPPDYARLLLAQGGGCAICKRPPAKRMLDIDHDHHTGVIRGLLCHRHNRGLGFFQAAEIPAVIAYLAAPTDFVMPKKKRKKKRT